MTQETPGEKLGEQPEWGALQAAQLCLWLLLHIWRLLWRADPEASDPSRMPASVPFSLLCVSHVWSVTYTLNPFFALCVLLAILRSLQVSNSLSIDEQDRAHSCVGITFAVILSHHHSRGLPEVRASHCVYNKEIKLCLRYSPTVLCYLPRCMFICYDLLCLCYP